MSFFNDTATTEIYTLSLHDALPIYLEEYDAYYLLHGDTNFQRCTVTSLEQNEDGTIALTYEQESGEKGIVTLKGSKGSYQFVSNKEA